MNTKFTLALSAALLLTGHAFAADSLPPNASTTPEKLLPSGSGSAIAQTQDATTSTTAHEATTTTTGAATGDGQTTTTTTTDKASETQSNAAPAVENGATGSTTTAATTTTTGTQSNNVQKLFHMLQHNNQPQSGATSPEAKPDASSTSGAKTAQ